MALHWGKDAITQKDLQKDEKKKQFDYKKLSHGIQKSIYYWYNNYAYISKFNLILKFISFKNILIN